MTVKSNIKKILQIFYKPLLLSFRKEDRAFASFMTLCGIWALFPFAIFAESLANFVHMQKYLNQAMAYVFGLFPAFVSSSIAKDFNTVLSQPHSSILTLSFLATAYFSSNGVEAVRGALDYVYGIEEKRSFITCRLQSLAFILLGTASLIVISFFLVFIPLAIKFYHSFTPSFFSFLAEAKVWRYIFAAPIAVISLVIVHKWLPAGKRSVREVFPGVIATVLLWLTSSMGFEFYLTNFSDYRSTYAGLASLMANLIFFHLINSIFLFGAELNVSYKKYKQKENTLPYQ